VALCGAFCLGAAASSSALQFNVVDLGPGVAFTIDDAGDAVGYTFSGPNLQAVEWTNITTSPMLVTLGPSGQNSVAFSINNGVIVGEINPSGVQEARRFDNSSLLDTADDASDVFNIAFNSNLLGTIVGMAGLLTPNPHAVVFPGSDLGNFGGGVAVAYDINLDISSNQNVVGTAATASGPSHAFLHAGIVGPLDQGTDDLGTLGGLNSEATCVNAFNQVAGWSDLKC